MKIDWKKEISLSKLRPSFLSRPSGKSLNGSVPKLNRSTPKLRRPSLGGPQLQAPKFATDIYSDLRDRHLLPLVALLIVAIVAAPILLSRGGGEEEPAAVPAAGLEGEAKVAGLTVVPAEDGLRNYKRRLGHRVALNPFRRPAEPEAAQGESSSSGSSSEGGPESSSSSEPTSASGEEVVKSTVGGVTTETIAPSTSSGPEEQPHHKSSQTESSEATESTEATPSTPAEPTHTESSTHESSSASTTTPAVVGYTIDAEAGFVPKTTEKTGIAPMTKLPNKQHPLVLFMGLSKDHKRALFLMTSEVTAYYGGHCVLDKQACQLVEVAPGKGVTFTAGFGSTRYKLHLKRIVPVRKSAG
jgi:hypothetical protein